MFFPAVAFERTSLCLNGVSWNAGKTEQRWCHTYPRIHRVLHNVFSCRMRQFYDARRSYSGFVQNGFVTGKRRNVISQISDDRILTVARFFQRLQQPANAMVQAADGLAILHQSFLVPQVSVRYGGTITSSGKMKRMLGRRCAYSDVTDKKASRY